MENQNRTQMMKLLIAHGNPAQKAAALMQLAAAVIPASSTAPTEVPASPVASRMAIPNVNMLDQDEEMLDDDEEHE